VNSSIYVYDLPTRRLVQQLTFPAGTNLVVRDVAFSPDSSQVYAVGVLNDQDSVFATATVAAGGVHTWGPTTVVCDILFASLASNATNRLFAVGMAKGNFTGNNKGLYVFTDPNAIPLTPTPTVPFNATGIMSLTADGSTAYVGEFQATNAESLNFDRIRSINLAAPALGLTFIASGSDFGNDIAAIGDVLFVTTGGGSKSLERFNRLSAAPLGAPTALGTHYFVHLARRLEAGMLYVSQSNQHRVVRFNTNTGILDPAFRIPVQIYPSSLVLGAAPASEMYVLNFFSNTVSVISLPTVLAAPAITAEPPALLENYRNAILLAFWEVLDKFFQYLKDCFCDKFLIRCPDCRSDQLYLGCITIRGWKVHHICNFEKRKYVRSVINWEYWLSAVPIIPAIKYYFARFCCAIF
jgi:hypothetical protein